MNNHSRLIEMLTTVAFSNECVTAPFLVQKTYPVLKVNGKSVRASRIVLSHKLGRYLSDDEFACHTCDNPMCLNPKHLFAGSHSDNMKDMANKSRAARSHHSRGGHKLTQEQLDDVRLALAAGVTGKALAERYNVTPATISRIRSRKRYITFS